jgi:hypothetical protein
MNMAERILQSTRELERRLDERDAAAASRQRYADAVSNAEHELLKRRLADARRADEAEQNEQRERLRRDAVRCGEHQRRYDESFAKFGRRAPPPLADDRPPAYRRRLFAIGQSMLPSSHKLAAFSPGDLDGHVIRPYEEMLLEALAAEAANPSSENLPLDANDPKAKREIVDDSTGLRHTEYKARRSFIWNLSRPGGRVIRLADPGRGIVLAGRPFPTRTV